MAKQMEEKAKNGLIREANVLFTDIYELMKRKRFSSNQKASQCNLYTKFVALHNMKCCYDDASLFTAKMIEFADANTPTILKVEVCINGAVACANKSQFRKASLLAEYGLAMAKEHFGDNSTVYAEALVALSEYLGKTDQHQKSNNSLETALKIVESREGSGGNYF